MKKTAVSLMLAAAMVMSACAGNKTASDSRTPESVEKSVDEIVSEEATPLAESEEEVKNEDVSDGDDSQTDDEYRFGEFTENGYISEYLGYEFTAPGSCVLSTQEEIAQMAGVTFDILEDDLGKVLVDYGRNATVFDLYASYIDNSANVNISVAPNKTNVTDINVLADSTLALLKVMDTMDVEISDERNTVEIAGIEYLNVNMRTTISGITMTQELYMALYKDKLVSLTVTYLDGFEDERDALIGAFTAL